MYSGNDLVLNKQVRPRPLKVVKSIPNWMILNDTSMAGCTYFNLFFDPSGSNSYATPNPATATAALNLLGIAEWSGFGVIYDQYKVDKIVLRARLVAPPTGGGFVTMFCRHNYDSQFLAADVTYLGVLPNVRGHSFSPEHQQTEWVIYPRCNPLALNVTGSLATEGRFVSKMRYTELEFPLKLLGASVVFDVAAWPDGCIVAVDCVYHMKYKYAV